MHTTGLCSRTHITAAIGWIIGSLVLIAFCTSNTAIAKPLTFLSPQQVPPAFLSVPYYGAKSVNSYFDHEFPDYLRNNRIVLYDGRIARHEYGDCGWNSQGNPIAYFTQPGGQGECIWYEGHPGYDFGLNYEPILAAADGQVGQAGWWDWTNRTSNLGLFIEINHADGYLTRYGHLSAIAVSANTQVLRGQIIGTSGNTGNSTGPHLHFEVSLNNNYTDPFGGAGAQWLWRDGRWQGSQWVGQPTPNYGAPLMVDDDNPQQVGDPTDDPNFTKGRTVIDQWGYSSYVACPPNDCPYWYRATNTGQNGDMLWTYTSVNATDYWARWSPPRSGLYDVQVYIPAYNATTWGARYCLIWSYNYMPSSCNILVDQNGTSNRWLSLGIYQFGSYPYAPWYEVWTDDKTGESQAGRNQLGVDAVRFRSPWPVYIPVVLKN